MKLRVKGCWGSMGDMDVWDKEYDINVEDGSDIVDVVVEFLKTERDCDDNDISNILSLIESGKWMGGRWTREDSRTLHFDGGDIEEIFGIV